MDAIARILASELEGILGLSVKVKNIAGNQSLDGCDYVARIAPADGRTLLCSTPANLAGLAATIGSLPFNPSGDLNAVCGFAHSRLFLVTSSRHPWKTLPELAAHARSNPGQISYGAASAYNRLQTEAVARANHMPVVESPFDATLVYHKALIEGRPHFGFMTEHAVLEYADKLTRLAQTGATRSEPFLDVPTFADLSMPHILGVDYSLSLRKEVPPTVAQDLYEAVRRAISRSAVAREFKALTLSPMEQGPEEAALSARSLIAQSKAIAQKLGILA